MKNYDLTEAASDEEFTTQSVSLLTQYITQSITDYGHCILGLAGGSTPRPIYEQLGKEDIDWPAGRSLGVDWNKVSIFLVDDRYINPDDDDSNQKLVKETLLKHAQIPKDQIVFPDTSLPIDECVSDYETRLATLLSQGIPHIVTIGMGNDGHITSLFPPLDESAFGDHLVMHTETDDFAVHDRISTTMVVLCSAERKIFLLGADKKDVWEEMMEAEDDPHRWPAKAVLKMGGGVVIRQT